MKLEIFLLIAVKEHLNLCFFHMLSWKASWKHNCGNTLLVWLESLLYIQMDYSQLKVCKDLDWAYSWKLIHSTEGVRAVFIIMLLCTWAWTATKGLKEPASEAWPREMLWFSLIRFEFFSCLHHYLNVFMVVWLVGCFSILHSDLSTFVFFLFSSSVGLRCFET